MTLSFIIMTMAFKIYYESIKYNFLLINTPNVSRETKNLINNGLLCLSRVLYMFSSWTQKIQNLVTGLWCLVTGAVPFDVCPWQGVIICGLHFIELSLKPLMTILYRNVKSTEMDLLKKMLNKGAFIILHCAFLLSFIHTLGNAFLVLLMNYNVLITQVFRMWKKKAEHCAFSESSPVPFFYCLGTNLSLLDLQKRYT